MKLYKQPAPLHYNAQIGFSGNTLSVKATFSKNRSADRKIDLQSVLDSFAIDHGCVTIGFKDDQLVWDEITRYSQLQRPTRREREGGGKRLRGGAGRQLVGAHYAPARVFYANTGANLALMHILTPWESCSLSDCTVIIRTGDNSSKARKTWTDDEVDDLKVGQVSVTKDGAAVSMSTLPTDGTYQFLANQFLPLKIDGPSKITAGQKATFTVNVPGQASVRLSTEAGQLSKTRVKGGQKFVVNAQDLEPGDVVRVVAGFEYWPNKAEKVIKVI